MVAAHGEDVSGVEERHESVLSWANRTRKKSLLRVEGGPQRLKPDLFSTGYVRAKARTLQPSTINPEFKDLARNWGWKMITMHEKMYP
jgi:hypothetical protein